MTLKVLSPRRSDRSTDGRSITLFSLVRGDIVGACLSEVSVGVVISGDTVGSVLSVSAGAVVGEIVGSVRASVGVGGAGVSSAGTEISGSTS